MLISMKKSLKVEMWIFYTLTSLRVVYGICGDAHTVDWIPQWTRGTRKFRLGTPMGVFQITHRETQEHKHVVFHHFLSHVICRGSSYDGVQWPLGEAFTRSVVDEGYHDNRPVHPRWGQLHQLTDIQINITGMNLCMCSTKQFVDHLWNFCCVYLRNVEKLGKVKPVVWIVGNIGQWCISYVELQLKGVPLAASFNRVC